MKHLILQILFLLLFVANVNSQTFHSLIFCNTNDNKLEDAAYMNSRKMKSALQAITKMLDYNPNLIDIEGVSFNRDEINKRINSLHIGPKDIVVVYFNSHGLASNIANDRFPFILIPSPGEVASEVHKKVLNKKPKFLLTIVETCNSVEKNDIIIKQREFINQSGPNNLLFNVNDPNSIDNVVNLFKQSCNLIVASADRGQESVALPSGSIFTNCLLRAFRETIILNSGDRNVRWDNILEKAKVYTMNQTLDQHYPIWGWGKKCLYQIPQGVTDSTENLLINASPPVAKDFSLRSTHRLHRLARRNRHEYTLEVIPNTLDKTLSALDSVEYFLHYTFKNPIVVRTNVKDNFKIRLRVWGTFPVKAKLYFKSGDTLELYKELRDVNAIGNEK